MQATRTRAATILPLCCAGFAGTETNTPTLHRLSAVGLMMPDAQSCTGKTLSWSPSTNPLTDDSASGPTKPTPEGKPTGGNAVEVPAASCPIDHRAVPLVSGRRHNDRPLFSSSEDELEERGKGVRRRTRRSTPPPKKTSRASSRYASPHTLEPKRSPRRPSEPDEGKDDDNVGLATEEEITEEVPPPERERSPRRSSSSKDGRGESSKGNREKEPRDKTVYYKLDTLVARSSRHSLRETNHRESPWDTSPACPRRA